MLESISTAEVSNEINANGRPVSSNGLNMNLKNKSPIKKQAIMNKKMIKGIKSLEIEIPEYSLPYKTKD